MDRADVTLQDLRDSDGVTFDIPRHPEVERRVDRYIEASSVPFSATGVTDIDLQAAYGGKRGSTVKLPTTLIVVQSLGDLAPERGRYPEEIPPATRYSQTCYVEHIPGEGVLEGPERYVVDVREENKAEFDEGALQLLLDTLLEEQVPDSKPAYAD